MTARPGSGYAVIFVPIPFVVLLLRLHLQAWGYYVAGALFIAVALVMYAWDLAAMAKRDKTIQAAERAQEAYEDARMSQRNPG
jgi:Na+/melibiose symporter-like transporter